MSIAIYTTCNLTRTADLENHAVRQLIVIVVSVMSDRPINSARLSALR